MIVLSNLSKSFQHRPIIRGLDLEIRQQDRIALIGSNGAGKTTLIRCLLGHYRYKGLVNVNGSQIKRRSKDVLSTIAFVPQLPPPLRLPVGELIRLAERSAGANTALMQECAGKLGLDLAPIAQQPFYRLSGGQKQKLLITIALSRDVDLFIFDEPSANLDPKARGAFIDLLAEMKNKSMLIASHRLEEVAGLVNRVIELDMGQVVLDDSVEDRLEAGDRRNCSVRIRKPHDSFSRAMAEWHFDGDAAQLAFSGVFAGGDTLRLLSLLARYSGLIEQFSIDRSACALPRPEKEVQS